MGRTECNRIVNFSGATRLVGQMIDVTHHRGARHSLRGEVLGSEAAREAQPPERRRPRCQRRSGRKPTHQRLSAQTATIAA